MTALWGEVLLEGGAVQHVRIPVRVIIVTPEQVLLGLGA